MLASWEADREDRRTEGGITKRAKEERESQLEKGVKWLGEKQKKAKNRRKKDNSGSKVALWTRQRRDSEIVRRSLQWTVYMVGLRVWMSTWGMILES